jgi:hypothetical protein
VQNVKISINVHLNKVKLYFVKRHQTLTYVHAIHMHALTHTHLVPIVLSGDWANSFKIDSTNAIDKNVVSH